MSKVILENKDGKITRRIEKTIFSISMKTTGNEEEDKEATLNMIKAAMGFDRRYEKEYNNLRHDFKTHLKEMGYYGNLDEIDDGRDEFVREARENR